MTQDAARHLIGLPESGSKQRAWRTPSVTRFRVPAVLLAQIRADGDKLTADTTAKLLAILQPPACCAASRSLK